MNLTDLLAQQAGASLSQPSSPGGRLRRAATTAAQAPKVSAGARLRKIAKPKKLGVKAQDDIAMARTIVKNVRDLQEMLSRNPGTFSPTKDVPTRIAADLAGFFSDAAGEAVKSGASRALYSAGEEKSRALAGFIQSMMRKDISGTAISKVENLFGDAWSNIVGLDTDQISDRLEMIADFQADRANALGEGSEGFEMIPYVRDDPSLQRPASVPENLWGSLSLQQKKKVVRRLQARQSE